MTSTPERPDGQPTEEAPDRSNWTVPVGHTDYAPLSGPPSYPGAEDQPYHGPPSEMARYRSDEPEALPPLPGESARDSRSAPTSHRAGAPEVSEPTSRGVLRHLLGLFVGLAFTPCAIALLAYGGYRYSQIPPDSDFSHDTRGLVTLGIGAFVLLLVACSGALSPLGPLLGSLWGLVPAGLYLFAPENTVELIADVPSVPAQAESGAMGWLAFGCYLAVGVTLFGAFVTAAARRRR